MLRGATASHGHADSHWGWYSQTQCPMAPPSARSAQGRTRQQTTARGHRGLLPTESCNVGRAADQHRPASPSAGTLCGCVSNPPSAEHRSRLSGRRPLKERPSTRISHGREVRASGSAGPGRWPASHVPTIARSRDFYFRKSHFFSSKVNAPGKGPGALHF